MRLDKLLVTMQIGTRSEVKKYIKQGKVMVDGDNRVKPEQQVDPSSQSIYYLGKQLQYEEYEYYMFYKPGNCVTARTDDLHKTVMDYVVGNRKDIAPVGRLDLDTEGLLLITNDGNLAHNLLSPSKHVKKIYEATIDGSLTPEAICRLEQGVDIGGDALTKPAEIVVLEEGEVSKIQITITEGRYHQVKRMFRAVGRSVLFLKRTSMGTLVLDESLNPGEYRKLTEAEISELKKQGEGKC